jgi:hypothetical protein
MRDGREAGIVGTGLLGLALLAALAIPGCGTGFGKVYEYEEDITLSLDGSATIYVATSLPALATLRGFDVPTDPIAAVDSTRIRSLFTSPVSRVTNVSTWRRRGRRFVGVRLDIADIRVLSRAAAFSWATYALERHGESYDYKQTVGASAKKPVGDVGWTGAELVAFRLHLPAKIEYHNAGEENFRRGNILVWEQTLADRRTGLPLLMEARMQAQSILYRTLWLFGISALAALIVVVALIWWVVRK